MAFQPTAWTGVLHHYAPRLVAFEFPSVLSDARPQNLLIWIGGLGDGLLTVPMPIKLAESLPQNWAAAQVLLTSSYGGWGTSSLKTDVSELSECVEYFRGNRKGKIVLMGHSTGCQDVMEYLTGPGREERAHIDGGIIQAPVSDREGLEVFIPKEAFRRSVALAEQMVAAGDGEEILPSKELAGIYNTPVSARRWLSLASPNHDGDDDYFSSDLTTEQLQNTFGRVPGHSPLCILYSGADEYCPDFVNKESLVEKWIDFVKRGGGIVDEEHSGVVPGASHNLRRDPDPVIKDLTARVAGFLKALDRN